MVVTIAGVVTVSFNADAFREEFNGIFKMARELVKRKDKVSE